MTTTNLQNLFNSEYPTVHCQDDYKIIGPVVLPIKNRECKNQMQTYLFSANKENYLVCLFGKIEKAENVLVRVSSACVFGFILNSLLCDCKNQYEEAVEKMLQSEAGILIFGLDQHGKGIGIDAHFLVYAEGQRRKRGLFSEIYEDLGLHLDYRDYAEVMTILNYFKDKTHFKKITMLTEAPDKRSYFTKACHDAGIEIDFDTFTTDITPENEAELKEKIAIGYSISQLKLTQAA